MIETPEQFANRLYLSNRKEFGLPSPWFDDQFKNVVTTTLIVERNKRQTFYEHARAEQRWARRHQRR